jgi:hypothetical protein
VRLRCGLAEAKRSVQGTCRGHGDERVEHDALIAAGAGALDGGHREAASHGTAPRVRTDEQPLHLTRTLVDAANRHATHVSALASCQQQDAVRGRVHVLEVIQLERDVLEAQAYAYAGGILLDECARRREVGRGPRVDQHRMIHGRREGVYRPPVAGRLVRKT